MPMCIWTARAPVRNVNKVLCVSICQCFVFERRSGIESIVKFDSSCSSTLQPGLLARSRQICSIAFDIVWTWILQGLAPGIPLRKPIEQHHSRVCLPSHQAKFSPAWQSGLCVSFSGCRGLMPKKSEVVGKLIRPLCKKGMLPHFLGHLNLKTWESSRWWPVTTSH